MTSVRRSASLLERRRRQSFSRLAVADALLMFGVVTLVVALAGLFSSPRDSVIMSAPAFIATVIGYAGHQAFDRRHRPAPGRIISGLASTWAALVVAGTLVYLMTGSASSVDQALFESAAGFSTVALSTIDAPELSLSMQLFRGATQWMGGLIGLLAAVIALPATMRGAAQVPRGMGTHRDRLAPTTVLGRRRVTGIYLALTVICGVAYAVTGMGGGDSAVAAMGTLSTGGFTNHADSLASASAATQAVGALFMTVGGMSYFAIWWALRGNGQRLMRNRELQGYLGILAVATVFVVFSVPGISLGRAYFVVASAASTTGLAIDEWTLYPSSALSILLVVVATGSMAGSAGSGLRIVRARMLVAFARRELSRQLDPHAVTTVRLGDRIVNEDEVERLSGYQVAHFGLCAIGAFFLTTTGVDLVGALWSAISVVSTAGPSPVSGAYGDADGFGRLGQMLLIPGMLAGRLSILPLLLAVVSVLKAKDAALLGVRRMLRWRP